MVKGLTARLRVLLLAVAPARSKLLVLIMASVGGKAAVAEAQQQARLLAVVVLAATTTMASVPLWSRLVDGALGGRGKVGLTLALLLPPSPSRTPCTVRDTT